MNRFGLDALRWNGGSGEISIIHYRFDFDGRRAGGADIEPLDPIPLTLCDRLPVDCCNSYDLGSSDIRATELPRHRNSDGRRTRHEWAIQIYPSPDIFKRLPFRVGEVRGASIHAVASHGNNCERGCRDSNRC